MNRGFVQNSVPSDEPNYSLQDIEGAFKVAFLILQNPILATIAVATSFAQLPFCAALQKDNRRARRAPKGSKRPPYRPIVGIRELLRFTLLDVLEDMELQCEAIGHLKSCVERLRCYIKKIVKTVLHHNSFYADVAMTQILGRYTANTTIEMYAQVAPKRAATKDWAACSTAKRLFINAMKQRFPDDLQIMKEKNAAGFLLRTPQNRETDLIKQLLLFFLPSELHDEARALQLNSYLKESENEMKHIRTFLDAKTFNQLATSLRQPLFENQLRIPIFSNTTPDGPATSFDTSTPGVDIEKLKNAIRDASARLRRASRRRLSIVAGSHETFLDPNWQSYNIPIQNDIEVVKLMGQDDDGANVTLARYFLIYDELPKTEAWEVSLPSVGTLTFRFEYGDNGVTAALAATWGGKNLKGNNGTTAIHGRGEHPNVKSSRLTLMHNSLENARENRRKVIADGLTSRRDLFKMGLLTAGGMLVAKSGLSARAQTPIPTVRNKQVQTNQAHSSGANTSHGDYQNCVPGNQMASPQTMPFGFRMPSVSTYLHNRHTPSESNGNPCDFYSAGHFCDQYYPNALTGFNSINAPDDDINESLSNLWYHDHRVDFTSQNTYKGLLGVYCLFNQSDAGNETTGFRLLSFPQFDIPPAFADKVYDSSTGKPGFDLFNLDGILGNKFLVNGTIQPFFVVSPRRYRFRLLNTGPSRFYEFFLTGNIGGTGNPTTNPFWRIATDGDLIPNPVQVTSVRIGPEERVDVIMDFSKFTSGQTLYLENRLNQLNGKGPVTLDNQLFLQFRVIGPKVADDSVDPARNPSFYSLPSTNVDPRIVRTFKFDRLNGQWSINGQFMDCGYTSGGDENFLFTVRQNSEEQWLLTNLTGDWTHPVHIHLEEHQILSRNRAGLTVPTDQGCKDVTQLHPNERAQLFFRFRDWLGKYPIHCHNVVHEDHAMMAPWQVQPDGDTVLVP